MTTPVIHMLGALEPLIQGEFEDILGALELLQQQVIDEIVLVGRAGVDVSSFQTRVARPRVSRPAS